MAATRTSWILGLVPPALVALAIALWRLHAAAWGLGVRAPILSFDPAQVALAALELARHGRLATGFALPIDLAAHPLPPWPLSVVQPGLVLADALLFRLAPGGLTAPPAQREWLALVVPACSYLGIALALWLGVRAWLARAAGQVGPVAREAVAVTVAAAALLDPEAQHFASGGFTELPFTLGIVGAFAMLASGAAPRRPALFGALLGLAGLFRGTMLWLLPVFALAAALPATGAGRHSGALRSLALVLAGWALPLAPWWIYKWRAFGQPGHDLSALGLWDSAGWTWFSLTHLPAWPHVPQGAAAVTALAAKLSRTLPLLARSLADGPRALWIGALLLVAMRSAPATRRLALTVLAAAAVGLLAGALGAGWQRYLYPLRVPLEAGGLLATLALLERVPGRRVAAPARRLVGALLLTLTLAWAAGQTRLGLIEARRASVERGLPSVASLEWLAREVGAAVPPGRTVMSNLGPTLAWYANRPVLHPALDPGALAACRARVEFSLVLLVFRDAEHAWGPAWGALVADPAAAVRAHPEYGIERFARWTTRDGFRVVWIRLRPAGRS